MITSRITSTKQVWRLLPIVLLELQLDVEPKRRSETVSTLLGVPTSPYSTAGTFATTYATQKSCQSR